MDRKLQQMIDACRPGRDDVREPDMAALADHLARDPEVSAIFRRSQHFDAAVASAFRDTPVPAGLEARLLQAVEAAPQTPPDLAPRSADHEPTPCLAESPPKKLPAAGFSRRAFWGAVGGLAAVFLIGYALFLTPPREVTPSQLVAETQNVLNDVDFASASAWNRKIDDARWEFPSDRISFSPSAWRMIRTEVDSRAVAYRIPVRNKMAYLLVMNAKGATVGLNNSPGAPLPGATGGWKMTAWSSGDLIYVLAFEDDYRALLRTRPMA